MIHDGDAVTELFCLFHVVGDIEDGFALGGGFSDNIINIQPGLVAIKDYAGSARIFVNQFISDSILS